MGLTSTLARTTGKAGIPLAGAIAFAGVNRIGWLLENQEQVKYEGATLNLDEKKLEQTMAVLGIVYVTAEAWTIRRLLASQGARTALQEGLTLAGREGVEEGAEAVAIKAGLAAGIGRTVGKVLLIDSAIWLITGSLDLGLNFTTMTEEEQAELFDWMGPLNPVEPVGGLSPLGEFVLEPILGELFDLVPESWWVTAWGGVKDTAEFLGLDDLLFSTAEQYIESIDLDLEWWVMGRLLSSSVLTGSALFIGLNPTFVFQALTVGIVAKVVFDYILAPAWSAVVVATIPGSKPAEF